MTLDHDLVMDGIVYTSSAVLAYVFFSFSQLLRLQYIEQMGDPVYRQITKFFEYLVLFISGALLVVLSNYDGILYYLGDLLLFGFFVHQFIKSDHLQRRDYLRRYNHSKHKLVNRMITNTTHFPMPHDN